MVEKDKIVEVEVVNKVEENEKQNSSVLNIKTELDDRNMYFWDQISVELSQSRELKEEAKMMVKEKLKAQHDLIVQKIGTTLDVEKKKIFDEYLDSVSVLEQNFIEKMDKLDKDNDEYMEKIREEYFLFFDNARENIKKWENVPERYKTEVARLDEQEQKRLSSVKRRLEKLEKKREAILDQTLAIFEREQHIDNIQKKFKLF